jgi:hypothetical protein
MTLLTGSPFFPGGLFEYHIPAGSGLDFEYGPTTDIDLQFATYYDASDQASLSRVYGGIHPPADDFPGRRIGQVVGPAAWSYARSLWGVPEPSSAVLLGVALFGMVGFRQRSN